MGGMSSREEVAQELLAIKGLQALLVERELQLRDEAKRVFTKAGQREVGELAGIDLGNVQLCKAEPTWKVYDYDRFLEWVKLNHPSEVVVREEVNPAFQRAVLADLKAGRTPMDPETGELECPGGIVPFQGQPSLRVTPSKYAAQAVLNALGDKAVEIGLVAAGELE
jgi:hypothetical protein